MRDKDAHLAIAKFPHYSDEIDTSLWEAVALMLATKSGISVPDWRLEKIGKRNILLSRRFDRQNERRIPFVSAMSMLSAKDNEQRSYLDIVDALRQNGRNVEHDLHQLWRRVVLNILISNTDDHLRNHGFLYGDTAGWQLSPAYDLNPVPIDIRPRILSTSIDLDDATASLDLALEVAAYFDINAQEARAIAHEVGMAVSSWHVVAASLGIKSSEIERMSSAFEHEDLKKSIAGTHR